MLKKRRCLSIILVIVIFITVLMVTNKQCSFEPVFFDFNTKNQIITFYLAEGCYLREVRCEEERLDLIIQDHLVTTDVSILPVGSHEIIDFYLQNEDNTAAYHMTYEIIHQDKKSFIIEISSNTYPIGQIKSITIDLA